MKHRQVFGLALLATLGTLVVPSASQGQSFYKKPGLFSTRPNETKPLQEIKRFGPVGIGIDLLQPAFVMKIKNIEEGSPAAVTGKLKKGQVIEAINGKKLADIDPRIWLGQILAKAEATDGLISLSVKGEANPVVVKVPVLGAYSKTWPLNCPKSDKIVRQVADHFAQPKAHKGFASAGMLFLLSTGEEKDLALAREWARNYRPHTYPWHIGYGGIGLAECYLRTGDKQILPHIQKLVDNAVKTEYLDGWLGRGGATPGYGNGHLNAAGTAVITFLILAKECGAKVPDETFDRVLPHFYRYAGRGGNPYGDNRTEIGFVDNGKSGNLAFAMAAGAAVMGEDSVYAGARDVCAMRSFYTTTFMLHGHTGGGIGEVWRSAAMSLLAEKKPAQYREFMDARQWHYDLSRRYNGSFGILGGSGYDKEEWGAMYPLAYTLPRKKLRIMGAPRGKFAKPVRLPKQPWGTEADNAFLTLDPGLAKSGQKQDMSKETLWGDSSLHFLRRFHGKEQPSDDEVRRVVLHPDHNIRFVGAHKVLGINSGYLGKRSGGGKVREALLDELLAHPDPRVKRAMYSALLSNTGLLTQKRFDQLMATIKDPNAAWSVKDPALQLVGRVKADWIVPHVDVLLPYLEHEEWWLQNAALTALTPIVADERTYKKVLPAVGKLVAKNQRTALTRGMFSPMRGKLKGASAAVRKLAAETLKESYLGYAGVKTAPGGQNLTSTYEGHLDFIASSLAEVPGGLDILYEVGRKKNPKAILPHKEYFLKGDPSKFSPTLKKAITPVIDKELIPEFVGRNHKNLTAMAAHEVKVTSTGGSRDSVDGLAALHKRAGRDEYGWHMFADWRNGEWSYHSFDPIKSEQVLWERMVARYRKVTPPKGMENWYTLEFNPGTHGWKQGKSPFGHYKGKMPNGTIAKCSRHCLGPHCYGGTKINSFWEKEVLLMRGKFKVPPLKEGHRYRLRVNDGNHVGSGQGHKIYINGKEFIESPQAGGRGSGALVRGSFITKEFISEFKKGEVTVAVITFLRYNNIRYPPKSKVPQGKMSFHLDEQKLPPITDELLHQSAAVVPMLSSQWQDGQDPEDREKSAAAKKYRWDGKFVANPKVVGQWKVLAEVVQISDFDPAKKKQHRGRPPFNSITFKDGGKTSMATMVWSNDKLMDLSKYHALKITPKTLSGQDYLFIEGGGFGTRNKPGWKSKLYVFKK